MPKKWMTKKESEEFLSKAFYGRLATSGNNEFPYITPLSFVYSDGLIYFHCATKGRKLDNIKENPGVCFEVSRVDKFLTSDLPCEFSIRYTSVLAFGKASLVDDDQEKTKALELLVKKYAPKFPKDSIEFKTLDNTTVVKITVEELSGKKNVD